jgi:HK97 family phage major capsid protein
MPYDSLTTRSDATPLMPEDASREILQAVTSQSFVLQLARRMPDMPRGERRIPVLNVLPSAAWINGDTGLKETTEVAWRNVFLVAEELAIVVPIPNSVIADAGYDIWGQISPQIATAFGRKIDQTLIYGSSDLSYGYPKPSNDWPEGIVKGATSAGHVVSLTTQPDLYEALLGEAGAASFVEADGYVINGHIAAMSMMAKMRGTRDANGQPIFNTNPMQDMQYSLMGTTLRFPNNGSINPTKSQLICGDWNQMIYAMRQDITYTMHQDGVISDERGNIRYNLMQQDMVAMRVTMRLAWALPLPVQWINQDTPEAQRYPFAVLTS